MQRVVIIGGGAIGSSIAYHLLQDKAFAGSVTVIERDPSYRRASSALSCSSIRVQFSTPVNIALSQFGLQFIKRAGEDLAVDGDRPMLGLREPGYLYAVTEAGLPVLHANHEVQRACGGDVAMLTPEELKQRFPWLNTDGLVAGSLGLTGEGWFNGPLLLAALRTKARALGATYIAAEAAGLIRHNGKVSGVTLEDGSVVDADVLVNATGGWAWRVAEWLGIDMPIRPRRRMVFTFNCRADLPAFPLLIDPTGIWARPEGGGYLCGFAPGPDDEDPDEPPLEIDETEFNERIWPVLAARVPAFEKVRLTGGWAGYYDMNLFDHNGVVGPHPAAPEVWHACGFSGHGMQHSPGVGRGVAEHLVHGAYQTIDLSPLATDRLARNERLLERCII